MMNKFNTKIDFVAINQLIADNAEKIFDHFEITYTKYQDRLACACPIHNSDNQESLTLFTKGQRYVGNFMCWTKHCEEEIGNGGINLIQFLLSGKGKEATLHQAANFVLHFLKMEAPTINEELINKKKFNEAIEFLNKQQEMLDLNITREQVRRSLVMPCDYYLKRGYSNNVLDKYDVGVCTNYSKPMYNRIVVPIYNVEHKFIGCVGRSLNPECPMCGYYHQSNRMCPTTKYEKRKYEKWINSTGFKSGYNLYNIWSAKKTIQETNTVIIVEGQGDVWKLEEAGIHNSVGLFGCNFTQYHSEILDSLGTMNIILALDNDPSGQEATTKIIEKLNRYYSIRSVQLPTKDVGDMSIQQIQEIFK